MQRDDAAAGLRPAATAARLRRDIQIAVRRDGHMPGGADIVRDDERTETLRQGDAAVVGIARDFRLAVHSQHEGDHADCGGRG